MEFYYQQDRMDNTLADDNLCNNSEIKNEFDDYPDDKVCIYETIISTGYIKQEPCDTEDKQRNIDNYRNIKDETIEDPIEVAEETGLMTDTKENYCICCDECGEGYDLYCLKCSILIRIFDSNNPNSRDNRVRRTLPKNFIDIYETPNAVGIVALRAIPKGVVFGPFEGLDSTKDGAVSKWKLKNKELAYIKDPKRLNWMQYVRRADQSSYGNLTPFQYEGGLYYRSDRHISVGDELLTSWNSGSEKDSIQNVEDGYWIPQVCERLDDTYACTLCCVGYKSLSHLEAHNSSCAQKRNQKDFGKEIMQCAFCKIHLDQKEYSDYHINRCCESNPEKYVAAPSSPEDTDNTELKDKYKCSMCGYSTSQKDNFKQHQLTHTDLRIYKCPQCPYRTYRKYCLHKHMRTHTNCSRSRFKCEHCDERFARFELFAMHQKKKHSVSVYKCDKCVFKTMNARNLVRHQAMHQAKPYCCNKCDKRFKLEKTLLRHVRNLHNKKKKKYKCPKCDFETIHAGNMKKHLMNIHSGVKRFKCPRCAFRTSYKKNFDHHLRYHEDVKPIKCESCDIEFWSKQLFVRHKKEVHTITNKTYSCSKCEYRTRRYYTFNQHLLRVHGFKHFACTFCPYKTTIKSNLKRHIGTHTVDKHFACTLCPYKTTTNFNLKRHILIHSDDKPFACTICPYKATRNSILKQHVAIHGNDKPFACTLCSYKATTNSNLKQHLAIHNDDRPFKCDMCSLMFKLKSSLTKHARNIHSQVEKMEYRCPQCPFETNYKGSIKRHVDAHNDSELFQCSNCNFNTYFKGHFVRHIKLLHASEVKGKKPVIESDD